MTAIGRMRFWLTDAATLVVITVLQVLGNVVMGIGCALEDGRDEWRHMSAVRRRRVACPRCCGSGSVTGQEDRHGREHQD